MSLGMSRNFKIIHLLLWFMLSVQLTISSQNDINNGIKSRRRVIRSPQLFPGRNVLPDLPQIKPLNDLNDIRQKFASLANLTALLEHALAAERTARSTLTGIVNEIKGKILGLQEAVNPDPENYWTDSKTCGGIMVSQTGRILYKNKDYYSDNERCIWTIRTNYRSKVKIAFTNGNLEEHHDYIAVTEIRPSSTNDNFQWNTKRIQPGQTNIFNGPLLFVTFVSDGSVRKSGWQLEFEGLGSNVNTKTIYQHFHLTDWVGHFDSANLSESFEQKGIKFSKDSVLMTTIVISPSYENNSMLHATVPENLLDLRPEECEKTKLAIFNDFAGGKPNGGSSRCCGNSCEMNAFQTSNRLMLGILASSDITDGSQFQINWETDTRDFHVRSVDQCGGILKGNLGTISYKVNRRYENNERCVWAIYQDFAEFAEIKLRLVKDGFEYQYDYITISYFDEAEPDSVKTKIFYKSGETVRVPSGFVFVEFYTDSATFGRTAGFELEWEIKYTTSTRTIGLGIDHTTDGSGTAQLSCSSSPHIYIVNPQSLDGGSLVLEIEESPESTPAQGVLIFKSERGNFSTATDERSRSYQSIDGVAIVIRRCDSSAVDKGNLLIKWRKEVSTPEDTSHAEPEVFIKAVEDECGQALIGDSGRISYKIGKEYNLNERCTWIIKSKSLSTITVRLMTDGFESCCDGVIINKIDVTRGTIDPNGVPISRENRFHTFDAQVLLVMFYSDHSVKGTGFTLEFQTKGEKIVDTTEVKHWYVSLPKFPTSEEPFGPSFIESSENSISVNTFKILQPDEGEVANSTKVTVKMEGLKTNECNQDSVALYHMPTIAKYESLKRYPDEQLCLLGNVGSVNLGDEVFSQIEVTLVVIAKFQQSDPSKNLAITFG